MYESELMKKRNEMSRGVLIDIRGGQVLVNARHVSMSCFADDAESHVILKGKRGGVVYRNIVNRFPHAKGRSIKGS